MEYTILFILYTVLALAAVVLAAAVLKRRKVLDIEAEASSLALKTMENAVIILDAERRFLCCNDSANTLFPSLASFPKTEPIKNACGWPAELATAGEPEEVIFESGGGENRPVSTYRANTNKIMDSDHQQLGWSVVIHDITEMNFLISQLESLATTDSLTGIANRRSFLEKVEREIEMSVPSRRNTSNALIMYDIDHFKKINDTYGHAAGDHVLCEIVEIVKRQLRSYDIIARYGGEEFLIFAPASKEESLYNIADRCCKAIEAHRISYNGTVIPVTASFGAVQMPPGSKFDEAMLAVDEAMYKAKHNGRNQVVVGTIKKTPQPDAQTR